MSSVVSISSVISSLMYGTQNSSSAATTITSLLNALGIDAQGGDDAAMLDEFISAHHAQMNKSNHRLVNGVKIASPQGVAHDNAVADGSSPSSPPLLSVIEKYQAMLSSGSEGEEI